MAQEACCTCASLLAAVPAVCASSEKPLPDHRQLDCCGRIICGGCIHTNPRFLTYCPYCQTSGRSPLISSRPRSRPRREKESEIEPDTDTDTNPPPYSAIAAALDTTTPNPPPPPYTQSISPSSPPATPPPHSKPTPATEPPLKHSSNQPPTPPQTPPGYTLHHLIHPPHPNPDTLPSLSLRYGIPARTLLAHNNIPPDAGYLLAARHTLLIPTAYITTTTPTTTDSKTPPNQSPNQNLSLSPTPPETQASRDRKVTLRRFMVACKEADYDAAVVYLEESGYDLDEAVGRYLEDAEWEREHPLPSPSLQGARKGKGKGKGRGRGNKVNGGWRQGDGDGDGDGGRKGLERGVEVGRGGGRMGWFKGLVK